jgi:metallo-beta-lactamase family protein
MNTVGKSEPTITFLGAAGTVTGSRFLLTAGDTRVLVDAGMFQGLKELRLKNWEPFAVDPKDLSAIVLTHAHLDHCGFIPKLVKDGFDGKIHSTENTAKLADVILRDSARIQTEDAKWAAKKGFSKHNPPKALYEEKDAIKAMNQFETHDFNQRVQVAEQTFATFHPAGHILGSSFVELEFFGKRLLFTGDMGRPNHPLLVTPEGIPAGHFDAIITESTYGDRKHDEAGDDLETVINETFANGGSILIPAFAVDRTEVILVRLRELAEAGKIPNIPIYADSPMALKALSFYREAINNSSAEIRSDVAADWKGRDPFDAGTLVELLTVEESMTVNDPQSPCIIISASGMGTGGRVVHHLRFMLPIAKNTVVMVGYQAIGTRGRSLVDGAEEVKMHGEMVPVRAKIANIQAFSVHADADEMFDWVSGATEKPGKVFVVHGESGAADALASRFKAAGWNCDVPTDASSFPL